MNEILVINKDSGWTSRDIVNKLCKILGTKKIGHTGTLDPLATGVLVCVTGKYTKLVDELTSLSKEYIVEIKLGVKTDSYDITGNAIEEREVKEYSKQEIIDCLNSFLGKSVQEVPAYSAIHVNGKRLYEYARNNETVELPKREINIYEIELLEYDKDILKVRALVSKGTYIRSLVMDICDKLNTIGSMSKLIRTKQGNFVIENSYTLEMIEKGNYSSLALSDVLDLQKVEVNEEEYRKVINGNKLSLNYTGYVLFQSNGSDIALYEFTDNIGKLKILF